MGSRQPDMAHHSAMSGLKLGGMYSAFIFVLFAGFPGMLVNVFHPSSASPVFDSAVPMAVFMVRVASIYVLVEAMLCVFIGALRGAGDTFWAMRMSVILHWAMVAVLAVILRLLCLPPEAGWSAMVFFFLVFSGVVFARYRQGKWRNIRIVEPAPPAEMLPDIGEV
jgi:MATE family multidrug resistance protein